MAGNIGKGQAAFALIVSPCQYPAIRYTVNMGQCPNMGKAPEKKRKCFVLRPTNSASNLTSDQRAAIDLQGFAAELRSYCSMLWDLDTLLLEYIGPDGHKRPMGSLAYSLIDIRHLILREIKDIISEMEGEGD